jgi:hypothetical protein
VYRDLQMILSQRVGNPQTKKRGRRTKHPESYRDCAEWHQVKHKFHHENTNERKHEEDKKANEPGFLAIFFSCFRPFVLS